MIGKVVVLDDAAAARRPLTEPDALQSIFNRALTICPETLGNPNHVQVLETLLDGPPTMLRLLLPPVLDAELGTPPRESGVW